MTDYRSIKKLGHLDYPGYIALQKARYGFGDQRWGEKRTILHNWYSALRGYLPVFLYVYEEDAKKHESQKKQWEDILKPKLFEVAAKLQAARDFYDVTFENPDTRDPREAHFETMLEDIVERLDVITALSRVLEKQKPFDMEDEVYA